MVYYAGRDWNRMGRKKLKQIQSKRQKAAEHRRRYILKSIIGISFAVLVIGGLILADHLGVFGRPKTGKPRKYNPDADAIARTNVDDLEIYHNTSVTVVHVVDGDTLDVNIPDKVTGETHTRVRLWGVDTPETVKENTPVQHFGPEASKFTKDACLHEPVRLQLVKGSDTRDEFGRLLAYVLLPVAAVGQEPKCLNAELIAQGYGYADPRFPHPRSAEFRDLQKKARESKVGLWAAARDKDLPRYYRGKIELEK